jgi:hypothetical protein
VLASWEHAMVLLVVHGSPLQSQRETLEFGIDGAALDRSRDVGSQKGFRRLKAYKQLPTLRAALIAQREQISKRLNDRDLDQQLKVA